ncbi:phosphopantetheine-binding protein [Streptomyces sp. WAC 05977]|nr:phosphopantetheine-binding protein [Streptomyces sp. WAC 05977]
MTSENVSAAGRIEAIWKDVLDVQDIRQEDTFFELGGQSVTAVFVVERIEAEFGVSLDIGDLFEDPDLATFTQDVLSRSRKAA